MADQQQSSALQRRSLPLTPDSPLHPTLLPHVKEPIELIAPIAPVTPPSPATLSDATTAGIGVASHLACETDGPSTAVLNGLHVLAAERDALTHIHHVYASSLDVQESFARSVLLIAQTIRRGGKLVVSGVGKSGKIGQKLVATCNSLRILAAWLHPTEALHGDLGVIGPSDAVLLLSYSSHSTELHHLLSHISNNPLIAVTGHPSSGTNPLFTLYPRQAPSVLLAASVPVPEKELFGVAAPTTSTTVALAVCDAVALAVAEELHADREGGVRAVFGNCHPGGAIGKSHSNDELALAKRRKDDGERMEMG